ncbi:MAG TPA: hypothetical protein VF411_02330 [Bacteroidia bacterium]
MNIKSLSLSIALPLSLGIGLFLFSCSNHSEQEATKRVFPKYHYALDSVIKSTEGIIGGIELGQSKMVIPAIQLSKALEKTAKHITYEQRIDSVSKYSISYLMLNDTITEIEVHITSDSNEEGDIILQDLKTYYSAKYTAPMMDKGYFVFNCFDTYKKNFTITLTDNSGPSNSVIDMLVYREK